MSKIQTNRDLYIAIVDLTKRQASDRPMLEEYLLALWGEARRFRERTSLSLDEFFELLSAAFTVPCPSFDQVEVAKRENTEAW